MVTSAGLYECSLCRPHAPSFCDWAITAAGTLLGRADPWPTWLQCLAQLLCVCAGVWGWPSAQLDERPRCTFCGSAYGWDYYPPSMAGFKTQLWLLWTCWWAGLGTLLAGAGVNLKGHQSLSVPPARCGKAGAALEEFLQGQGVSKVGPQRNAG